jgi:hypothetical protein
MWNVQLPSITSSGGGGEQLSRPPTFISRNRAECYLFGCEHEAQSAVHRILTSFARASVQGTGRRSTRSGPRKSRRSGTSTRFEPASKRPRRHSDRGAAAPEIVRVPQPLRSLVSSTIMSCLNVRREKTLGPARFRMREGCRQPARPTMHASGWLRDVIRGSCGA